MNDNYYIIEFCNYNVIINNLFYDEIYSVININDSEYRCGFILKNNGLEYLYYSSNCGNIVVYNLYNKQIVTIAKIECYFSLDFIQWNKQFFLISDYSNKSIIAIDTKTFKKISEIKEKKQLAILTIKKVIHPLYGESILVLLENGAIQLWNQEINSL